MKAANLFLSLFLITGLFLTGCEKFELEDHCPEEEQSVDYNPQDLRVNDDTDNEEELGSEFNSKSLDNKSLDGSDAGNGGLNQDSPAENGNDSGSGDNTDDSSGDDDDTVNDDSDNEDEHPRRPQDPAGSGSSSDR